MTSWRHFVTLFHHANMRTIIKLSSATKEITETTIKLALLHICRLRWRQFVSWCHVVNLMTSWRHVMTWRHHANTYTMIAWNPSTEIFTEIHVYHHFRTSTSWYRRNEFCDVMTSRIPFQIDVSIVGTLYLLMLSIAALWTFLWQNLKNVICVNTGWVGH